MMTNVLALPFAHLIIEVANNQDWVDSLVYLVTSETETPSQLDLRGLDFEMHIRRWPQDNEVVLSASTAAGSLSIGAAPNFGHLIIFVRETVMRQQWAGKYVGDVVARDRNFERRCLTIDLAITEGITR
jgi:hypothetical protein